MVKWVAGDNFEVFVALSIARFSSCENRNLKRWFLKGGTEINNIFEG